MLIIKIQIYLNISSIETVISLTTMIKKNILNIFNKHKDTDKMKMKLFFEICYKLQFKPEG